MAKKNTTLRRITAPGLLGTVLLCHEHALAQQSDAVHLAPNAQVLQAWQQGSGGGPAPVLAAQEGGGTRLEWKLGESLDAYSNNVQSAGGQVNTPLRSGTFFRNTFRGDLRAIHADQAVDYFQLGTTHSNDPAVLSQGRRQVNNLQLGRTGPDHLLALGDIAPNFSSLGSSLGARGLLGQRQFGGLTVSGFTGLVAQSWEALENRVPRLQPVKDVHGIKLEKAWSPSLRTYVTGQGFSEREASAALAQFLPAPGRSRSASAGFAHQQGQLTLTGEMAGSRFENGGQADRSGHAGILDATWRKGNVGLRAGYHDISTGFTSLSLAAQSGVREAYAGADWTAGARLTLSADLRRSRNTTLATADLASTGMQTDALATRAMLNFGPDHPGWSLSLQQLGERSTDLAGAHGANRDTSGTLNYSGTVWNASVGYGIGAVRSTLWPENDSRNSKWSLSVGHSHSDGQGMQPATWRIATRLSATAQKQRLQAGGEITNTSYTISMTGERTGQGSFSLLATGGTVARMPGGPSLRQRSLQLDASYPVGRQVGLKAYLRSAQRNIADPQLSAREKAVGLQLTCEF